MHYLHILQIWKVHQYKKYNHMTLSSSTELYKNVLLYFYLSFFV